MTIQLRRKTGEKVHDLFPLWSSTQDIRTGQDKTVTECVLINNSPYKKRNHIEKMFSLCTKMSIERKTRTEKNRYEYAYRYTTSIHTYTHYIYLLHMDTFIHIHPLNISFIHGYICTYIHTICPFYTQRDIITNNNSTLCCVA